MRPRRRSLSLASLTLIGWSFGNASADDPKPADPATDTELLEFLGSVDSGADQTADDGSWIDYLSQTDIGKVARVEPTRPGQPPGGVQPPPPPPARPPARPPGAQDD